MVVEGIEVIDWVESSVLAEYSDPEELLSDYWGHICVRQDWKDMSYFRDKTLWGKPLGEIEDFSNQNSQKDVLF